MWFDRCITRGDVRISNKHASRCAADARRLDGISEACARREQRHQQYQLHQRHELHERILHAGRRLDQDHARHNPSPEIDRLGDDRRSRHRLSDGSGRQRAHLHSLLSQPKFANHIQPFLPQLGGVRYLSPAFVPAADGSLGRHRDLVLRTGTLQDLGVSPDGVGECQHLDADLYIGGPADSYMQRKNNEKFYVYAYPSEKNYLCDLGDIANF